MSNDAGEMKKFVELALKNGIIDESHIKNYHYILFSKSATEEAMALALETNPDTIKASMSDIFLPFRATAFFFFDGMVLEFSTLAASNVSMRLILVKDLGEEYDIIGVVALKNGESPTCASFRLSKKVFRDLRTLDEIIKNIYNERVKTHGHNDAVFGAEVLVATLGMWAVVMRSMQDKKFVPTKSNEKIKIKIKKDGHSPNAKISDILIISRRQSSDEKNMGDGQGKPRTFRWEVSGHWRKMDGVGKNMEGIYCVENRTWVSEHEAGDKKLPLIKKIRVIK